MVLRQKGRGPKAKGKAQTRDRVPRTFGFLRCRNVLLYKVTTNTCQFDKKAFLNRYINKENMYLENIYFVPSVRLEMCCKTNKLINL